MKSAMPNWSVESGQPAGIREGGRPHCNLPKPTLRRAQETVNEVQATLDWATIRSPIDGTVIDKKVDVGDMVTPGQMLVTLFDPKRMQLVASVRESLTHRLQVGQSIGVQVEGLNKQCSGTVSEIVPEAQSASRSFQVKVTGPCPPGIYSGMFGRILIPLDRKSRCWSFRAEPCKRSVNWNWSRSSEERPT